jgi:deoxyuridine 5'-triphosphate nucleotidohydrolase
MRQPNVQLDVLIAPLTAQALLPKKAHPSDAGFDLAIPSDCMLPPHAHQQIDLSIALQIPSGWYGQVFGRSSVFRRGISVHPGVIDADYRGAVQLLVYNHFAVEQQLHRGDRLAQLLLLPVPVVRLIEVSPGQLDRTPRGAGGVGSTGR